MILVGWSVSVMWRFEGAKRKAERGIKGGNRDILFPLRRLEKDYRMDALRVFTIGKTVTY